MSDDVDVVVPVRNRILTVQRTIDGVLRQSYDRYRLILIDDGSEDGTSDVVSTAVGDRVSSVRLSGAGPSAARNAGAAQGNATWLVFLDCDDVPKPNWIADLMAATEGADLISCGAEIWQGPRLHEVRVPSRLGDEFHNISAAFLPGMFAVRRSVFEAVGGYDEELWFGENYELGMRISDEVFSRDGAVVSHGEALVIINQPPTGASQASRPDRLLEASEMVLRKHAPRLARTRRLLGSYHAIAGVNALRLGLGPKARRHLRLAVTAAPFNARYWVRLAQAALAGRCKRRDRGSTRSLLRIWLTSGDASGEAERWRRGGSGSEQRTTLALVAFADSPSTVDHVLEIADRSNPGRLGLRSLVRLRRVINAIDPDVVMVPKGTGLHLWLCRLGQTIDHGR